MAQQKAGTGWAVKISESHLQYFEHEKHCFSCSKSKEDQAMTSAMNLLTPTLKDEKKSYTWTKRPSLASKRHKVSFSGSSKGSTSESQDEASSSSESPKLWAPSIVPSPVVDGKVWQAVDRKKEAIFV